VTQPQPANPQVTTTPPQEQPAQTRAAKADLSARAKEVAEKFQYGDPDEGAAALTALLEEVVTARQGPSPDDIATSVMQRVQADTATRAAVEGFSQRHPEVVSNEVMLYAQFKEMQRLCAAEMRAYQHPEQDADGRRAVIPQSWIDQLERMQNPQEAFRLYGEFRKKGWQLPDVADRAAEVVERQYRLRPAPAEREPARQIPMGATPAENRLQRAEAAKQQMPQQPRRASVTNRAVQPAPAKKRTPAEVVAQMRRSYGRPY
jgi:hypothetical protein